MATIEERLAAIEKLLFPSKDDNEWTYEELRTIIDKTDLTTDMQNQGLMNVGLELERVEQRLDDLGKTDAHNAEQTLENRLAIMEGNILILEDGHLGYTNSDEGEFKGRHGFEPSQVKGDIMKRIEGIQKKLDRISILLKDKQFKLSGEEALKL